MATKRDPKLEQVEKVDLDIDAGLADASHERPEAVQPSADEMVDLGNDALDQVRRDKDGKVMRRPH